MAERFLFQIKNLHKKFPSGTHALKGVTFNVEPGEFLAIIGLSGSGKSTLLRCLNQLILPTSGEILFQGQNISKPLTTKAKRELRSQVAMIFQQFNLVKRHSVMTNVLTGGLAKVGTLPSLLGQFPKSMRIRAEECLELVGLSEKATSRVDRLSGGQQQRVAIARAILQNPKVLLADEPVASLDPSLSHSVMDYLQKLNQEHGMTILCNLHFLSLVRQYAHRVIALKDGEIVYQGSAETIDDRWFREIYGEEAREVQIR